MASTKEIITLKDITQYISYSDDGSVLQITQSFIRISEIISELKNVLKMNNKVSEIIIKGSKTIHLDEDFTNNIWHGKNVIICTGVLKIKDKIKIDVSGKDSGEVYEGDAGTGEDGNGSRGADGYAGESGGHIVIEATKIENPQHLTLVSNGGNGSRGQDGGNGRDGQDGTSITRQLMIDTHPSFLWPTLHYRQKGMQNLLNKPKSKFTTQWSNYLSRYWEIDTNEGKLIYSYYDHPLGVRQFFLIHHGVSEIRGGQGGACGVGGDGGFSGRIYVSDPKIKTESYRGYSGADGKVGLCGKHGEKSWDIGYIYKEYWINVQSYGEDQNTKLKLEFCDKFSFDSVWSPYHRKYVKIVTVDPKYAIAINRKSERRDFTRTQHSKARENRMTYQITYADNTSFFSNIVKYGMGIIQKGKSLLSTADESSATGNSMYRHNQNIIITSVNDDRVITEQEFQKTIKKNNDNYLSQL